MSFIMIILFDCLWPVQKSAHNLAKPVEQQHQRMRTARLIYYVCVSQGAKSLSSLTYLSVQSVHIHRVHRVQGPWGSRGPWGPSFHFHPSACLAFYLFWDFAFCPAQRIRVFPEML